MSIARLVSILVRFESHNRSALPRLLVLSDEARGFGLQAQLKLWPQGAAIIERSFGRVPTSRARRTDTQVRLATCSPRQARVAQLHGIHWPQQRLGIRRKSACVGLIETCSAHSGLALAKAAQLGLDGVLVSTAFRSNSPSASRPLGAVRLARLQRAFPGVPLFALGGINLKTARALIKTGIYGIAIVSFDGTNHQRT